jgi:hypothetical protein
VTLWELGAGRILALPCLDELCGCHRWEEQGELGAQSLV